MTPQKLSASGLHLFSSWLAFSLLGKPSPDCYNILLGSVFSVPRTGSVKPFCLQQGEVGGVWEPDLCLGNQHQVGLQAGPPLTRPLIWKGALSFFLWPSLWQITIPYALILWSLHFDPLFFPLTSSLRTGPEFSGQTLGLCCRLPGPGLLAWTPACFLPPVCFIGDFTFAK